MKIAFNCRCFSKKRNTGIGRYAYNLIKELKGIDSQNKYILYTEKNLFDVKRDIPRIKAKNFTSRRDFFKRGVARTLGDFDIYHTPCPEFLGDVGHAEVVVTIHDLIHKICPQVHTEQTIESLDKQINCIVKKASKVICISQSTADDLIRHYRVDEKRISLVYNGVDKDIFYCMAAERRQEAKKKLRAKGIDFPYLLFVGTIEPRKNLKGVLYAFKQLKDQGDFDGKVVVVGMKGWLSEDLDQFMEKLKITDDVIFLGYMSNDDLRYLYNMAEVFVFPSLYEGFGFPVLEAFCCGAPVVTSNSSSLVEIASDAALTIDPLDDRKISAAIKDILKSPQLKEELIEKGKKRSKDFSFQKTAQETLQVYHEVARIKNGLKGGLC